MTDPTPAPSPAPSPAPAQRGAAAVMGSLGRPEVAVMLALGFSSGLPFLLVGNTFGYWLRDEGISLKAIGFLSWAGLAYSLKVFWAPLVDRLDAPLLGRWLGRRRGWMALAQVLVALGLAGMGIAGPGRGLAVLGGFAILAAFASATQDIVIDAWRIESAANADDLGLLSSAYQLGYRVALLATDALILFTAARIGWANSYLVAAACMAVGLIASVAAIEPERADAALKEKAPLWTPQGLFDAIVGPFIAFFQAHGRLGVLMLAAVALYRLPDFVMGPMANPFYHDLGLSKDAVALVRGSVGLVAAFAGIAAGGLSATRFGLAPTLIAGALLQPAAVAAFALLPIAPHDATLFGAVMAGDNFAMSFAGVALVAYMSSLTELGYTATQYALLSSTYAFLGKFLKGFSGVVVEHLSHGRPLAQAYALFFVGSALIGAPALLLVLALAARLERNRRAQAA